MAETTESYRVSVEYLNNADKKKTLSYSGVKSSITQDEATMLTQQLATHGDDIFQNGVQEVVSVKHVKTETTTTEFTPYKPDSGE